MHTGVETEFAAQLNEMFRADIGISIGNWRYTDEAQELISTKELSELANFEIDVVEYYDTTEYMNISASDTSYFSSSALNDRYWEPTLSGTRADEIPSGKIVDFYRNIVGLDLNTTNNDEYYLSLTDFLNTILATYLSRFQYNIFYPRVLFPRPHKLSMVEVYCRSNRSWYNSGHPTHRSNR